MANIKIFKDVKYMKILIPNATSPKNIGDLAMLTALISLIDKKNELIVHSTESELYKSHFKKDFLPTLYSWAVFEEKKAITRIKRVSELILNFLMLKKTKKMYSTQKLKSLITDYKKADVIIFVGGGYLRSQKGLKQTLNLLMTLSLFHFAKLFKKRIIIAPMSFGPFAYEWQERYAASVLKGFDLVAAREKYSYELLRKYNIPNLIRSHDTALLLNVKRKKRKTEGKKIVLGFTIRKWFPTKKQEKFEHNFFRSIRQFAKSTNATIQPIVQVDAPEYGDIDAEITDNLVKKLSKSKINVRPVRRVEDLNGSTSVYSEIDLMLGMRMHSNILAALHGTPFVAVSYEHKTKGIAQDLGLIDYCVNIEEADKKEIVNRLKKAHKNLPLLRQKINVSIERIRYEEITKWKHFLT